MRVAVVGSRTFCTCNESPCVCGKDELVRLEVAKYISTLPHDTIVVSGGARGVDGWAEIAALALGMAVLIIKAQWNEYGRSAGYRRNKQVVYEADMVVAFWNGESAGTKSTIDLALIRRRRLEVIFP